MPTDIAFRWLSITDVKALPPLEWLVDGFMHRGKYVMLVAPPNAGKTFLALDLAMHVAQGTPWMGHDVEQGSAVYVIGEGLDSMRGRLTAFDVHRGVSHDDLPVAFIPGPFALRNPEVCEAFVGMLRERLPDGPPKLIVFDPMIEFNVGGQENLSDDVPALTEAVRYINRETGATVMFVHHTGHDGKRERGSSGYRGAVDTTLFLQHASDGGEGLELSCLKQRDGDKEAAHVFCELLPVTFPDADRKGRPIVSSSCVVMHLANRLTNDQQMVMEAHATLPDDGRSYTAWQRAADAKGISKARFDTLRRTLVALGWFKKEGAQWVKVK